MGSYHGPIDTPARTGDRIGPLWITNSDSTTAWARGGSRQRYVRLSTSVRSYRTLPILDAAHIRPYEAGGEHDVTNGLLLRTDIHRLFDKGYVTISNDSRFEVGQRLKADFENGRDYYAMHGQLIAPPRDGQSGPSRAAIEWHQTNRFLG
jgi:HNH endonuclease